MSLCSRVSILCSACYCNLDMIFDTLCATFTYRNRYPLISQASNSKNQLGTAATGMMKSSDELEHASSCETHSLINANTEVSNLPNECIICLEEFDNQNPAMHTLCACGENKVLLHYPCLLLWIETKNVCPTCSSTLYYQVGA
jgi:hypothetical protein